MSFADNFRAWWKLFEDDVCTRDMEFCRRLHPGLQDIATWIRATGYDGTPKPLLKTFVDAAPGTGANGSKDSLIHVGSRCSYRLATNGTLSAASFGWHPSLLRR